MHDHKVWDERPFGMVALETQNNPYLGGDSTLSCSPQTAATIDDMVVETVREGYDTAMDLLEKIR